MKRDDTQNQTEEANATAAAQEAEAAAQAAEAEGQEPTGEARKDDGADNSDISKLLAQLDQATAEAAEYKERYMRSVADFDNFRKRATREKEEIRRYAAADVVETLLPVLDNMKLALDSARTHHPEASAVIDGVDMILNQMKSTLKNQGLDELNPQGEDFDPNKHESIAHQPSDDVPEGKVAFVTRVGYTLNGRLLRPASVVLSAGPQNKEA